MATTYKIHPAIGIARVGNSPDEFFIGPERTGERPNPPGGFKDAECRVKRQAARFRIFAHHDDGSVEEITDAEAEITWEVHLANRKAAYAGRGNSEPEADLVIDPGSRSTDGPNQSRAFDTGTIQFSSGPETTVPLGEMRTDDENHLLVLAAEGAAASPPGNDMGDFWANVGWYDDIADGPVQATIRIRATGDTPDVESAWVITAPPKFSPFQDSPTTLYDRVFQAMVDAGKAMAPAETSYTKDVYPILQRARDIRWVFQTSAHAWPLHVTDVGARTAIFDRLDPPSNMPQLQGSDSALTSIQYTHMERWKDDVDAFDDDWAGVPDPEPSVSPAGMDRAALDACVGAAFFPGIEAGGKSSGNRPILEPGNYDDAFRIKPTVQPGTISASMALPWQADFIACGSNWWPVPRPNKVIPQGTNTYQNWARDVGDYQGMVDKWHTLGFVVQQDGEGVEVGRCDTASITLLTPSLNFADVPQGTMSMVREQPLAIQFEVVAPGGAVTLEYAPGGEPSHAQLTAANTSVTVGPTTGEIATARLWIVYTTGAAGTAIPTQTVTVRESVSGQTWEITIDANTVERKTAAVALVLDRSGSMSGDRGDGTSKHASLQQAAGIFVDLMLDGDGVGLVRYNQDADVVQSVKVLGAGGLSDLNRNETIDLIQGNNFDPDGYTSIGDGIYEGQQILIATGSTYDVRALTVLTDGVENRSRYIADVAPEIDETTYAIGLGTPENTSAPALQTISGNHGGFLLVTGAIGTENRFLLQKYFLQILAGVSQAEVVLDPDGELVPRAVHKIPFQLTEADSGVDVILLSPYAKAIDFRLQTPTGLLLEPWRAQLEPAMRYSLGNGMSYYRLVLPTQLVDGRFDQEGTWHVVLTLGHPRKKPTDGNEQGVDRSILEGLRSSSRDRSCSPQGVINELRRRYELAHAVELSAVVAEARVDDDPDRRGKQRTVPYSVVVHSYSSASLEAKLRQSSYEPGAGISLSARLTQSGLPLEGVVWADVVGPGGTTRTLRLREVEAGSFAAEFVAANVGTYRVRVRGRARTRAGSPFVRERALTAAVWLGGDRDANARPGREPDEATGRDDELCALLKCLLRRGGAIRPDLEKRLREQGWDLDQVRGCLEVVCRDRGNDRPAPADG